MDFKNASELLALCAQQQLPISEIMRRRECELGETFPALHQYSEPSLWTFLPLQPFEPPAPPAARTGFHNMYHQALSARQQALPPSEKS